MDQHPFLAIWLLVFVVYVACSSDIQETVKTNKSTKSDATNSGNEWAICNIVNEKSVISNETIRQPKFEESRNYIDDSNLDIDPHSSGAHRPIKRFRKSFGDDKVDPNEIRRRELTEELDEATSDVNDFRTQMTERRDRWIQGEQFFREWRRWDYLRQNREDQELIRVGSPEVVAQAEERIGMRRVWLRTYNSANQLRIYDQNMRDELADLERVRNNIQVELNQINQREYIPYHPEL